PHRLIERGPAVVDLVFRAAGDDALRSPLRDQQAAAAVFDDDGEASALEVERNLVDLSVSADGDPAALENRLVQWTLDASLVDAVDVGEGKRPLGYLSGRVKVPIEHHLAAGQRAGFVTAEHVHSAEILDVLVVVGDNLLWISVRGGWGMRDG